MNAAGELTLGDLMLSLAERMGWHKVPSGSDNRSTLPDDPNLRDRLLRAVNAGRRETYRRMATATCFRPILSVVTDPEATGPLVLGGDSSKYRLPYFVQSLAGGAWTWSLLSSGGYGGTLQARHQSDIAAMHATTSSQSLRSAPRAMAFGLEKLNNPAEPGRRQVSFLYIYPKPDQAYILQGQARVMFEPLVALTDLEPMGQEHVETIITGGERDIKLNHPDLSQRADVARRFEEAIALSTANDNERRPQTLGVAYDPDAIRQMRKNVSPWPDQAAMVTHLNGVPLF